MAKATAAIDQAFEPPTPESDKVLFWLPVTPSWVEQLVLCLTLICHSSFRGVIELMDAVFDYRQISLGSLHNVLQRAIAKARELNDAEDLSAIAVGAHDEIRPVSRCWWGWMWIRPTAICWRRPMSGS